MRSGELGSQLCDLESICSLWGAMSMLSLTLHCSLLLLTVKGISVSKGISERLANVEGRRSPSQRVIAWLLNFIHF